MKANPGGQLSPSEVIGRDRLIARLWRTLESQSVVLTAERRIGKTQVVKKMTKEVPGDTLAYYNDLEKVYTAAEFTETVWGDVEKHLSRRGRVASGTRKLFKELAGAEVAGIRLPDGTAKHWKRLLQAAIADLVEQQDQQQIVFFWDELPMMLLNVMDREGKDVAMEMLDVLRSLRQTYPTLRMVFTGSIGLHNIIAKLKKAGYANAPLNDMRHIEVPVLALSDAKALVHRLFKGERIEAADAEATVEEVCTQVDCYPYYLHHVVSELTFTDGPVDAQTVDRIVSQQLIAPQDPWQLRHYLERIQQNYEAEHHSLIRTILDTIAHNEPITASDLLNLLRSQPATAQTDAETLRDLLTLLQRDHYIELHADGTYRFQFPLIRRWWRRHRP